MRRALYGLLPLALGGCLPQNQTLESQHKPIIADGKAVVGHCPDWSTQTDDSTAATSSNYGCATNSNLAAMIAHPEDLVHGAAAAAGARSDLAVRTIRGNTSTAAPAGGAPSKGPGQ